MDKEINYNKIGICIINTDRPTCLFRLLSSIVKFTPSHILNKLNITIVDDSLQFIPIVNVAKTFPFATLVHTGERIGVARNTNRALQIIKDKEYSFIFNNDCEICHIDWINFYYNASLATGIHHFCFKQDGIWGAGTDKRPSENSIINGISINTIHDFPQGAILVFDKLAFETVGYFDAKLFVSYGKAHWDWSFRISESGIQPKGIHDLSNSNHYFKVYNEPCITEPKIRSEAYRHNTEIYNQKISEVRSKKRSVYVEYSNG